MAKPAVLTVADTIAKSFLLAVETRGDRPSDGSSSSSSAGRFISARPIASICCSPPESCPAGWLTRSRSRGKYL